MIGDATTGQLVSAMQLSVGLVFCISAAAKVRDPLQFIRVVAAYKLVPASVTPSIGFGVIALETSLAVAFVADSYMRLAALVAPVLVGAFMVAVGTNLWHGRLVPCGCFGDSSVQISAGTVVRLAMLLVVTITVLLGQVGILRMEQPLGNLATWPGLFLSAENLFIAISLIVLALWVLRGRELLMVARGALGSRGSAS